MISESDRHREAWHKKTYSGNEKLAAVGVFAGILAKHESAESLWGDPHKSSTHSHA